MKNKGFTLIELLVVIAIIGVLSGIVMVSLSAARTRSLDAKIKAQLSGARNSAEQYLEANSDYGITTDLCDEMFADPTYGMATYTDPANYPALVSMTCRSTTVAYAMSVSLPSAGTFFCIDSAGSAQEIAVDLAAGDDTCN